LKKIILASNSPRRAMLLNQIKLNFEVIPPKIDEKIDYNLSKEEIVKKLSYEKSFAVAKNIKKDFFVVGADTLVVKNEQILGKPKNHEDAKNILEFLSGTWHEVITGFTIIDIGTSRIITEYEVTKVKMYELSNQEINEYILTEEPFDKAGGYGIQGLGSLLIEKIEGCFYNIVGLPIPKFYKSLKLL